MRSPTAINKAGGGVNYMTEALARGDGTGGGAGGTAAGVPGPTERNNAVRRAGRTRRNGQSGGFSDVGGGGGGKG